MRSSNADPRCYAQFDWLDVSGKCCNSSFDADEAYKHFKSLLRTVSFTFFPTL